MRIVLNILTILVVLIGDNYYSETKHQSDNKNILTPLFVFLSFHFSTTDLVLACENTSLIIHALPCQLTPGWYAANRDIIPANVCICSTAKGLYVPTKQLLGDAIISSLERKQPLAFLSGPSFAAEIMKGDPTAVVVASKKLYHATAIQRLMSNDTFRIYTTQDVVGVQLGKIDILILCLCVVLPAQYLYL